MSIALENISLEMFSVFKYTISYISFPLTMSGKLKKWLVSLVKEIYQTENKREIKHVGRFSFSTEGNK